MSGELISVVEEQARTEMKPGTRIPINECFHRVKIQLGDIVDAIDLHRIAVAESVEAGATPSFGWRRYAGMGDGSCAKGVNAADSVAAGADALGAGAVGAGEGAGASAGDCAKELCAIAAGKKDANATTVRRDAFRTFHLETSGLQLPSSSRIPSSADIICHISRASGEVRSP